MQDNVPGFFENPHRQYSIEFGWEVARFLLRLVNSTPDKAWDKLAKTYAYYDAKRSSIAMHLHYRVGSNCLCVACIGLTAVAKRMTGCFAEAYELLSTARDEAGACVECLAEIERWACLHHLEAGTNVDVAEQCLISSDELAAQFDGYGHNLNLNKEASSALAWGALNYGRDDLAMATQCAERVIRIVNPAISPNLFGAGLHNLAMYIVKSGNEERYNESERLLDSAAVVFQRLFKRGEVTTEMAKNHWTRGMLRGRRRNTEGALTLMEKSRKQLIFLNLPDTVMWITSDMARLNLLDHSLPMVHCVVSDLKLGGGWQPIVPNDAKPLLDSISAHAIEGDPEGTWKAILDLRKFREDEKDVDHNRIPCLLPDVSFDLFPSR